MGFLAKMQLWHPQKIDDLPSNRHTEKACRALKAQAQRLAAIANLEITQEEAMVLLLKVRMNSFGHVLNEKFVFLNHSDFANCVNFCPGERKYTFPGCQS